MTQEKVDKLLEFARELEEDVVVVTKARRRVFIDFSDEEYKDTHIFNNHLYIWDTTFNLWNLVLLEDIKCIEFH